MGNWRLMAGTDEDLYFCFISGRFFKSPNDKGLAVASRVVAAFSCSRIHEQMVEVNGL